MEPKTKYQFSYFIQHYEIKEENYEKYIYGLLNKKDCKVHYFEKERDLDIYSYFLPVSYTHLDVYKSQRLCCKIYLWRWNWKIQCTRLQINYLQDGWN